MRCRPLPLLRVFACLLFPVASLLLTAACSRHETAAEAGIRDQTLLLGNGAEPKDLDPQVVTAFTDGNILVALFEGLTCIDEKSSQPVPGIAERWETSPDGLTWTFHLRTNSKWSNGDPVTADDFVYSVHRMLSPKFAAEYSYMMWPLQNAEAFNTGKLADFSQVGVRALDPQTLQLTLGSPCPWLLALTAPAWAATLPDVPPLRVSPRFHAVGPGAARGALVWLPGTSGAGDPGPPGEPDIVGRLAGAGLDVWRFDRPRGQVQAFA